MTFSSCKNFRPLWLLRFYTFDAHLLKLLRLVLWILFEIILKLLAWFFDVQRIKVMVCLIVVASLILSICHFLHHLLLDLLSHFVLDVKTNSKQTTATAAKTCMGPWQDTHQNVPPSRGALHALVLAIEEQHHTVDAPNLKEIKKEGLDYCKTAIAFLWNNFHHLSKLKECKCNDNSLFNLQPCEDRDAAVCFGRFSNTNPEKQEDSHQEYHQSVHLVFESVKLFFLSKTLIIVVMRLFVSFSFGV